MLKKAGFKELISAVQNNISQNAGIVCYDAMPENAQKPYCFIRKMDKNSKMVKSVYIEIFSTQICAVPGNGEGEDIYTMVQKIEEGMTEDISLPEGVELLLQTEKEQSVLCGDETTQRKAELVYEFKVAYPLEEKV